MDWDEKMEAIIRAIEDGDIPPKQFLREINQATLGMCVEIVKARRELGMRRLVDKVLHGSV
jgi:hypothetical protein